MLYQEMLESLEEAILVIKGNKIEFQNQPLKSLLERAGRNKDTLSSQELLKLKFLQFYHKCLS